MKGGGWECGGEDGKGGDTWHMALTSTTTAREEVACLFTWGLTRDYTSFAKVAAAAAAAATCARQVTRKLRISRIPEHAGQRPALLSAPTYRVRCRVTQEHLRGNERWSQRGRVRV